MSTIVLPGDHLSVSSGSNIKLGPGLAVPDTKNDGQMHNLVVTLPGHLGQVFSDKGKARVKATAAVVVAASTEDQMQIDGLGQGQEEKQVARWVESQSKRYLPALHDSVICQITNRGTESYQVTLFNSYTQATVSAFAFEGATKRNKPNLKVGTLLYAQVISANRHLEVELSCVDPSTGKSNGYGELKTEGGVGSDNTAAKESIGATAMLWTISCGLSRSLLKPSHSLLTRLATHFPFEVAVGVNGHVWVRVGLAKHVIAVGKVLEQADLVRGSNLESSDALQVARNRGVLSVEEISAIVQPFK